MELLRLGDLVASCSPSNQSEFTLCWLTKYLPQTCFCSLTDEQKKNTSKKSNLENTPTAYTKTSVQTRRLPTKTWPPQISPKSNCPQGYHLVNLKDTFCAIHQVWDRSIGPGGWGAPCSILQALNAGQHAGCLAFISSSLCV